MIATALKKLIRAYHYLLSPLLGTRCRYAPTCSDYANQAIDQYGPLRGSGMAVKRFCRCHPWGGEGYDPVPDNGSAAQTSNT